MNAEVAARFAVCFLTALFCGMGAGGGGLLTLYLSSFSGFTQLQAQGINLISFVSASSPASVMNLVKYKPDMRLISFLTFAGAAGCIIGALFASYTDQLLLRRCCGAFLLFTGLFSFYRAAKNG